MGVNLPKFDDIPLVVQELAWNCYIAGRIELVVRGHTEQAYIYDINSAFPYAMTLIPEPTKGEWIQTKQSSAKCTVGIF